MEVVSPVDLKPICSHMAAPYNGPMTSPSPINVLKMPEDMLFTCRSCPGKCLLAASTMVGSARISPIGMKRPSTPCPMIMTLNYASPEMDKNADGPTKVSAMQQSI